MFERARDRACDCWSEACEQVTFGQGTRVGWFIELFLGLKGWMRNLVRAVDCWISVSLTRVGQLIKR